MVQFGYEESCSWAARATLLESSPLPGRFHGDPADRLLVATARMTGARLLTKDERLLAASATLLFWRP